MKRSRVRKYVSTSIASMLLAFPAFAGDLDGKMTGSVAVNLDYLMNSKEVETGESETKTVTKTNSAKLENSGTGNFAMRGRKSSNGYFALGKVDVDFDYSGTSNGLTVDEAFIQYGTRSWNVEVGRVGSDGVYGFGQDTLRLEASSGPAVYNANSISADGIAINLTMPVELQLYVPLRNDGESNIIGLRPRFETKVADMLTLKAAVEMQQISVIETVETEAGGTKTKDPDSAKEENLTGFGFGVGYDVEKFGVEFSYASKNVAAKDETTSADAVDPTETTTGTSSIGLIANVYLGEDTAGIGIHSTTENAETESFSANDTGGQTSTKSDATNSQTSIYLSYSKALSVDGTFMRFGYSMATVDLEDETTETYSGLRVQLTYDF